MEIEKKAYFNLYSHQWLARKKTTHVNIMRFYLITWYFSRSNLSWIVMNRRSNRLQKNRSINMICTTVHVCTDNIKMWWEQQTGIHGAAKCRCFLPHFWCLQQSTITVQTHGKMWSLCFVYVITWPQGYISIHILHTLLYKFLLVLTRRIYLKIKASCVGDHFLYSHDLNEWFSSITVRRN